jgi:hypothetical protein
VIGGAGTYRERVVPRFRAVMQKHAAATTPPPDPERLKRIAFQIDGLDRRISALLRGNRPAKPRDPSTVDKSRVLERGEVDAILFALVEKSSHGRDKLGPRALRAFLFGINSLACCWSDWVLVGPLVCLRMNLLRSI